MVKAQSCARLCYRRKLVLCIVLEENSVSLEKGVRCQLLRVVGSTEVVPKIILPLDLRRDLMLLESRGQEWV